MQSKSQSLVETCSNVGIGFVVSYLLWLFLLPLLFDIETSAGQGLGVTLVYTVASILRGFLVRRFFVWRGQ